jgi:hypothetical protein
MKEAIEPILVKGISWVGCGAEIVNRSKHCKKKGIAKVWQT